MLALLVVEGKQKMVPANCKDAERESYESTCQKMKKKRRGRKEEMKNVFKKKNGTLLLQQGREREQERGGGAHQPLSLD